MWAAETATHKDPTPKNEGWGTRLRHAIYPALRLNFMVLIG